MELSDRDIDSIYTVISVDETGKEGIVLTMPPIITSSKKMALDMIAIMEDDFIKKAEEYNIKIQLVKFSKKEVIQTFGNIKRKH